MSSSNAVAVRPHNLRQAMPTPIRSMPPMPVIDDDRRRLWEQLFFKGIKPEEMEFCIAYAAHRNLDPIRQEIVFNRFEVRQNGRGTGQYSVVPVVTATGYRVQAVRTGEYQGQTPREWCGPDGVWKEIWDSDTPPTAARVGIRRAGFPEPQYAVAMFRRFAKRYPARDGQPVGDLIGVWKTNPDVMLATRAETAAFKMAFPETSDADVTASRARAAIRAIPGSPLRTLDGAMVYAGDVEMGDVYDDLPLAEAVAERDLWSESNRALHALIGELHPDEDTHAIVHDLVCARFGVTTTKDASPEQLALLVREIDDTIPCDDNQVEGYGEVIDGETGEIVTEAPKVPNERVVTTWLGNINRARNLKSLDNVATMIASAGFGEYPDFVNALASKRAEIQTAPDEQMAATMRAVDRAVAP